MQLVFGAGVFWGTPLFDASGAAIAVPTPIQLGVMQELSVEVSFDSKLLYGQNQMPVAVGRGKGKMSGKLKNAQLFASAINSLIFGQSTSAGILGAVYDTTGAVIPSTPFTITPVPPSSGTWSVDLGVTWKGGVPMKKVASAPATGQYSVTAGAYLFAAADVGLTVFICYQYTATSTTAQKAVMQNVLMGNAPFFKSDFYLPYQGKQMVITIPQCLINKWTLGTKIDDFMIPELDFDGFADTNTNVAMQWSLSE